MWLNKLEEKFGKYAIPNLPKIIVLLYAIGFVLERLNPNMYEMLALNPYWVLHGQVWRIITFLLIAPSSNLIFIIFVLLFYYSIGSSLEQVWGSFRFNMYYFIGVLGTILGAFLTYAVLHFSQGDIAASAVYMDTFYLNMTMFLAYAMMFPDMQVYLYMIVPIRVKWLAYLDGIYLLYIFLSSGITAYGISVKVSVIAAMLNFLLFFFSMRRIRNRGASFARKAAAKKKMVKGSSSFAKKKDGAMHECAVCHRTELDDPTLEFRYCSKCDGDYEYCQDHLFTHKHVKK
ncbi:rhomboid family intramembrane serine protease [Anaerostipes sp.]|uniref:rhomboid family intramembrane serine protease n=1 Tax=Anaerostipes sp. TaxID=1872530 RepID=UPI003FEE8E3C